MSACYSLIVILLLPVFTCSLTVRGQGIENATEADFLQLYSRLVHNYSRHLRPITNQSAAIDVSLDFSLLSIFDVDDVKQQISVMAMITVKWVDKNLVWNPVQYGGINRMFLKQQHIWIPEVYVESGQNSVILFTLPTQHVVHAGGTVTFTSVGNVQSPCSLDLTVFPYDTQVCKFRFGVLDSTIREVNLLIGVEGVTKSRVFTEDGEWKVIGTDYNTVFREDGNDVYGTAQAILKIKRRSTYYIINILVPAVAIAILSLLTFAVPVESGERLAYALTILLSLSVYITYIGGIMPMSSVNMPIIFYLLLGLFMISSMCVVMTVLVIAIRWSRVISIRENEKIILIFGVPFKIKRSHDKHHPTFSCCASRFQSYLSENVPDVESRKTWTPDRLELWEFENSQVYTVDSLGSSNKVLSPLPLHATRNDEIGSCTQTVTEDKLNLKVTEDRKCENSSLKSEHENNDQTADPDIMVICNRLNLYSFVTLLLSFLLFV